LVDESRLISGFLHTEIASAIKHRDKHDLYDGDWLDDPVSAITTGRGFSEEILESVGIKMQVNVCLDCSNSMLNNGLAEVATACMRTIYLALVKASDGLPPGSLVVNSWLWALGDNGKVVEHLERMHYAKFTDDNPLGPMAALPVGKYGSSFWSGEDTWLYPLLEKICTWEENYGDARAYRLDLIITDGVLEHKTDPGKCDKIQDTRDGVLQTIVLNFLPPENWADTRVPIRCIQYSVDVDNIFAVLRSVLGDWLVEMM